MDKLRYKTFEWPTNPHTYKEKQIRTPYYVTQDHVVYFNGMSEPKRIITGSGAFIGYEAYAQFQRLRNLFADGTAGELVHPIWGTRYCYFTGLELTQEPRMDYVSYTFEFTGALPDGIVPH